jgi:hypothetical protein
LEVDLAGEDETHDLALPVGIHCAVDDVDFCHQTAKVLGVIGQNARLLRDQEVRPT